MSCRVVPADRRQSAEPLKLARGAYAERPESKLETPADPAQGHQSEEHAQALHTRIVELERQLQSDVTNAREAAFREGEKAGRESVSAEVRPVIARLGKSLEELAAVRGRLRRDAEADLVQLAIAIARRILHREIAVDPDALSALVKTVLDKVQSRDVVRVSIHPDYEPQLRACFKSNPAAGHVQIEANPALSRGDLVVETTRGQLDASIDTQLDEIERGFVDRIRR
jgi:flagellar assembly protein FliH